MKFTLKKAHKIQKELEVHRSAHCRGIEIHRLSVETRADVEQHYNEMFTKNASHMENSIKAINLIYSIRAKIKTANAIKYDRVGASIDDIIAQKAHTEEMMKTLRQYSAVKISTDADDIDKTWMDMQVMREANSSVSALRGTSSITVSGKVSDDVHKRLFEKYKSLKNTQSECTDKLGVLNNLIEIELSADDVLFLKELNIL